MKQPLPIRNPSLLAEALTHPSARKPGSPDNQRLEFLGDAVIQLVVSEEIFRLHREHGEGVMTKLRAALVSRTALAELGREVGLPDRLDISPHADRMGARTLPSTLADAFEAVAGAIFRESGLEGARAFLLPLFLRKLMRRDLDDLDAGNPRSQLQEILQAIAPEAPEYQDIDSEGPSHAPVFRARVVWRGLILGEGEGSGKKAARTAAAADALRRRLWNPPDSV